jgi:pentatricopeptide repeat protein
VELQNKVLDLMDQEQVPLTAISYEYLLKGLVRAGNSRDVMDTLTTMKERGVEPTLPTYGYAIRACLENNNSTMAYDLMKEAEAANLPLQTEPRLLMDVLRTCALNDKVRRRGSGCHGYSD